MNVHQIAFADVFAEEVQGGHEVGVAAVEVSDFEFEVFEDFERGKLHDEVGNAPLLVLLGHFVPAVCHLGVDVAPQFNQKIDNMNEFVLKLEKLFKSLLFGLVLVVCLEFGLFLVFLVLLHHFFEGRHCVFGKVFDEEQQEVKTIVVYLLYIAFQLTLTTLLQLSLHELHLLQSPAPQVAQTVQDTAPA